MVTRLSSVLLFCYLSQLLVAPQQATSHARYAMITENYALSMLRSKLPAGSHAGFATAFVVEPTPDGGRVAERSWEAARSERIEVYENGIFVNLLRYGCVAVLEFDSKTDMATKLHLVTLDQTGQATDWSSDVDGDLKRTDALAIIDRSKAFAHGFFSPSVSTTESVLGSFDSPQFRKAEGYLAIPDSVAKLAVQAEELQDLQILSGLLQLWPIRHAPFMPVYAANPYAAVQSARMQLSRLERQFSDEKKVPADFVDQLLDLSSIRTQQELTERLRWLTELNSFLEKRGSPTDYARYQENAGMSAIPLKLGVTRENSGSAYAAMTVPGLICIWERGERGEFVLRGIAEGE